MEKNTSTTTMTAKLTQPAVLEKEPEIERGNTVFVLVFLVALVVVAAAVYFI